MWISFGNEHCNERIRIAKFNSYFAAWMDLSREKVLLCQQIFGTKRETTHCIWCSCWGPFLVRWLSWSPPNWLGKCCAVPIKLLPHQSSFRGKRCVSIGREPDLRAVQITARGSFVEPAAAGQRRRFFISCRSLNVALWWSQVRIWCTLTCSGACPSVFFLLIN